MRNRKKERYKNTRIKREGVTQGERERERRTDTGKKTQKQNRYGGKEKYR